ncbi:MAG: helix-turn-helix transcriptional regulator [Lachnospiraceae bacterium]|jgi:transcriptional regulator with XRE-family HTH domain|nr:helix-turn-helix transcriptional regulator [Lachnospiraceae bacterium]
MYDLYCKFRDKKSLKDSDVAKATGIPQSTFSDWKSGRSKPNTEKLIKIADYLDTLIEYLDDWKSDIVTCPDCGLTYDSTNKSDIMTHEECHAEWKQATLIFGELFCNHAISEKIKTKNRVISQNANIPLKERYQAAIMVLKCLFSRSVEHSGFNPKHVAFDKYVAMMLNNEKYRKHLDDELCQKLIANYGTMDGIKNGKSIYNVPESPETSNKNGTHRQGKIMRYYEQLNSIGKDAATEQARLLTLDEKYTMPDNIIPLKQDTEEPMGNAAHVRTDLPESELTPDLQREDEEILKNF